MKYRDKRKEESTNLGLYYKVVLNVKLVVIDGQIERCKGYQLHIMVRNKYSSNRKVQSGVVENLNARNVN